ncbi:MAG: hypothetical protein RJAPGHWK_001414, partial [Candidatus Fervidibacter sp.]
PMEDIPVFVRRRHGEPIEYLHPKLEPILRDTFGVMLYQEQVMRIANELAGFSMPQAEILMRAMGKKKADLMEKMRPLFLEGAVNNGVSREVAEQLWERMSAFAQYAFNKSHSAAYALVAYQTAYLKANFPVQYMTAFLSANRNFREKIVVGLEECRRMKIPVLPPDINRSDYDFRIEEHNGQKAIRFGLGAIKNVGDNAVSAILQERQRGGPFTDLADFLRRVRPHRSVTRAAVECLIKVGAFDALHPNRQQLLQALELLWEQAGKGTAPVAGQTALFGETPATTTNALPLPEVPDAPLRQRLEWERELLGVFLSANPLQAGYQRVAGRLTHGLDELPALPSGVFVRVWGMVITLRLTVDRQNRPLLFARLQDHTGSEAEVVLSGDSYQQFAHLFEKDALLYLEGTVRIEEQFRNGETSEEEEEALLVARLYPRRVERFSLDDAPPSPPPTPSSSAKGNGRIAEASSASLPTTPIKTEGSSPSLPKNLPSSRFNGSTAPPAFSPANPPTLQGNGEKAAVRLRLYLPEKLPKETAERLKALLVQSPGETPVEAVIRSGSQTKTRLLPLRVQLTPQLYRQLVALLGKDAVRLLTAP